MHLGPSCSCTIICVLTARKRKIKTPLRGAASAQLFPVSQETQKKSTHKKTHTHAQKKPNNVRVSRTQYQEASRQSHWKGSALTKPSRTHLQAHRHTQTLNTGINSPQAHTHTHRPHTTYNCPAAFVRRSTMYLAINFAFEIQISRRRGVSLSRGTRAAAGRSLA